MTTLQYGPLNKSLFTQELELIVKCLLQVPHKAKISFQNEAHPALHIQFGKNDINLSALFKRANFSHIILNENDSQYFKNTPFGYTFNDLQDYYRYCELDLTPYQSLTDAEKNVIIGYTGSDYYEINNLLYGKKIENNYYYDRTPQDYLRDVVIKTTFLASALNKIDPDLSCQPSFRGEHNVPQEVINQRLEVIKEGGGIIDNEAYLSTSNDLEIAECFADKSIIYFDSLYGKNISNISLFPSESEFLLNPGQIFWESVEEYNGTYFFHAKVVAPLIEGKDHFSSEDLHTFRKLVEWATQEGINTDFITPHLQQTLKKANTTEVLSLTDCLNSSNEIVGLDNASLVAFSEIHSQPNNSLCAVIPTLIIENTPLIAVDAML